MSVWPIAAGGFAGLGCWLVVSELVPAGPSLRAAIDRLDSSGNSGDRVVLPTRPGQRLAALTPWVHVPVQDLRLLGQDPSGWLARKVSLGFAGLAGVPVLSALLALGGLSLRWTIPAGTTIALAAALFLVPDVATRMTARAKRADFRYALTSYLDLVALERGAGAAPTEALEAAAEVGRGWAFERIRGALSSARKASAQPWDGLASLAEEIGISELADLAEITSVAGQDGARILDTLSARAESMRAEALAAAKSQAGARSTTMVLPIALLAGGFLVLLIFPDFYRLFG
ncbi:MAG TPA: type II secretion system F family protein [Streptosporangiaceae bacterium]|nr:type II secretion system F family protein [Streptosporangiaceae bacterium]